MKKFIADLYICTEYLVEEIDTRTRRSEDDEFTAGYKIVKPTIEEAEKEVLLIKLSNGKFIRYTDIIGLNNILNRLRLSQSDGPKVLEEQGYLLKSRPSKKGDIFVNEETLREFKGTDKKAKEFVKKRKESKK